MFSLKELGWPSAQRPYESYPSGDQAARPRSSAKKRPEDHKCRHTHTARVNGPISAPRDPSSNTVSTTKLRTKNPFNNGDSVRPDLIYPHLVQPVDGHGLFILIQCLLALLELIGVFRVISKKS